MKCTCGTGAEKTAYFFSHRRCCTELCLVELGKSSWIFLFCALFSFMSLNLFLHVLCHFALRFINVAGMPTPSSNFSISKDIVINPSSLNLWILSARELYPVPYSISDQREFPGHWSCSFVVSWHKIHFSQSKETVSSSCLAIEDMSDPNTITISTHTRRIMLRWSVWSKQRNADQGKVLSDKRSLRIRFNCTYKYNENGFTSIHFKTEVNWSRTATRSFPARRIYCLVKIVSARTWNKILLNKFSRILFFLPPF